MDLGAAKPRRVSRPKHALASIQNVDVFIVGHAASEQTRKEMVDWLKTNFPRIKIVSLIPPGNRQLESVDCSIVLNDWNEWLLLLEAAAG
jgi:5'(3')-deoxyribonucleotidase